MDDDSKTLLTEVHTNQKWLMKFIKEHDKAEREWRDKADVRFAEHGRRIGSLEADMYVKDSIIKFIKWMGAGAILLLTLKFGDIPGWWNQ